MRLSRETLSPAMVLLQIVTLIGRYVGMEIAFCQIIFQIDFFHGFSCCAMHEYLLQIVGQCKNVDFIFVIIFARLRSQKLIL